MGRKKSFPLIEKVTITSVAAEGNAIAKYNDMVIFVPMVVPGDVVDLQVVSKRKNFMEARAVKFHSYSDTRVEPFCSHFGVCGGCKWQMLPYTEQLFFKQKQVTDALQRIAKVELPAVNNILGSSKTREYRNKLEFTFSPHRWLSRHEIGTDPANMEVLGFHIPKLFDKILDIDKCYLQPEPSNQIRLWIKNFTLQNNYPYYSAKFREGFMRNIIIRTTTTGQVMVIVVFANNNPDAINHILQAMQTGFGNIITSIMYVVNTKVNDTINDLDVVNFSGPGYIVEQMEELEFRIGPKSFYQTNPEQAYQLYKVVRQMAGLTGTELVYDLYTGTGTIALFVAKHAKKVIGIEYVPDAIEDAKNNAKNNNINNTAFFAGDMKDVLNQQFIEQHGTPDIIITDPPRAGMHTDVINAILFCAPKKVVYVSCNPATQARDIELLSTHYKVAKVQPVDMFPHTHHVENVVLLIKL